MSVLDTVMCSLHEMHFQRHIQWLFKTQFEWERILLRMWTGCFRCWRSFSLSEDVFLEAYSINVKWSFEESGFIIRIKGRDNFVTMARNVDYIRTCTLPVYSHVLDTSHINESNHVNERHDYSRIQEAPPVIRRRERNKKDNSANRRSRPASWFVSHFSFDKLFNRGNNLLSKS